MKPPTLLDDGPDARIDHETERVRWDIATEATNRRLGAVAGVNYYPGVECEHGFDFCPECDTPEPPEAEDATD